MGLSSPYPTLSIYPSFTSSSQLSALSSAVESFITSTKFCHSLPAFFLLTVAQAHSGRSPSVHLIVLILFSSRHKLFSYQFGFLSLCLVFAVLRFILFLFMCALNYSVGYDILYWYVLPPLSLNCLGLSLRQLQHTQNIFHAGYRSTFSLPHFPSWFSSLLISYTRILLSTASKAESW